MNDSVNPAVNQAVTDSLPSRAPADRNKGTREQGSRERNEGANSGSARLAEFQHAREDGQPDIPDDDLWLVGYRVNAGSGTTTLLGFNPALTETLRKRHWATLIRDTGWVIPTRYLAHVERLLLGADVALFDVDGFPTPGQRARDQRREHADAKRVLDEIRAARDAAEADPAAVEQAKREAFAAFCQARDEARRKHGDNPESTDHRRTA